MNRTYFWLFGAALVLTIIALITSIIIVQGRFIIMPTHQRVQLGKPEKPAVEMTLTHPTTLHPVPTNHTLVEVTLHCKTVCSNFSGGVCVPLDLAIFVYKVNIPTPNMTFELQNHHPVVLRPRQNNKNATQNSEVLEVDRCNLEDHWPGVQLIPRQVSCAVVGNSGILNNSSCGEFIDSHDFVIRANMGLIKGYEADVGRRSQLNAFNRASVFTYGRAVMESTKNDKNRQVRDRFFDHIRTLKESILWYPKQLSQRKGSFVSGRKYRSIIEAIRKEGFSGIRFAFSWKPIHVEKQYGIRRTGTLGLDMYAVARTFCSNITLFGFYPFYEDLQGRPVKYHYYEDVKFNYTRNKGHQFSFEHTKLKELAKQGNITLIVQDCVPRKHGHSVGVGGLDNRFKASASSPTIS